MVTTDFLSLLIDNTYFPSLQSVVILLVIPNHTVKTNNYALFTRFWSWLCNYYQSIFKHATIVSFKVGLWHSAISPGANIFDLCQIYSAKTLDKHRTSWLKLLNNSFTPCAKIVNLFVSEWNSFTSAFL